MKRHRPHKAHWIQYWPLGLFILGLALLYLLAPVLTPFITAAVLAYILEPVVNQLTRRRCPPDLAVCLVLLAVMLILVALVLVIVPIFVQQLSALVGYIPTLLTWLRDSASPWLNQHLGMELSLDPEYAKAWLTEHSEQAGKLLQALLPSLTSGGMAVIAIVGNLALIPLVLFYFLRDWQALLSQVDTLLPRRWRSKVHELVGEADVVLGQFLRGQLSVILIMALFYSVGLWLTGLKSALPIGIVAGLLVFIPYLGVVVGVLLASLTAVLQFHSLGGMLPVWGVFLFGQLIEGFYVTPRLVGERIGLHPVAVVFALMAFGQLFGFVGVLLALPMAAMLLVGLRHVRQQYLDSVLYRRQP
ncbi:AI-2E family transporter [Chitinimonas sp. BJB300]|uniref:AI-2E family transporter n=1 Tax=Chitinimonas sp. BJB300 TaxID=1559339 RepID=UPI000C114518|nr:AI-2E family transporter [Chitinimonas sp. BJB300]PHV11295.1 AI-2E family transporter [Chitinimonas sp. BJB300]TSJ91566.1 AI-2E family transporter [Chitinimonas sp. BJB300]